MPCDALQARFSGWCRIRTTPTSLTKVRVSATQRTMAGPKSLAWCRRLVAHRLDGSSSRLQLRADVKWAADVSPMNYTWFEKRYLDRYQGLMESSAKGGAMRFTQGRYRCFSPGRPFLTASPASGRAGVSNYSGFSTNDSSVADVSVCVSVDSC